MSLYQRGKTWWISFTTVGGQRIRKSSGTTDKKQAQEYHDRLKAELWRQDVFQERRERTWDEAVVKWLQESSHKATHDQDIRNLRWLDQFLGGKQLREIDRETIADIGVIKAEQTSPSNANRYLALVKAILRKARDEWEWIDKIPKIRMFPIPESRIRWLTREEAQKLISLLPSHQAAMVRFALATGLRQANVKELEWSQVDLEESLAWIHPEQAKARKAIPVPLSTEAKKVLNELQGDHERFVFTYRGKPIKQVNTKAWKKALAKCGLEDFRWHDLRHTWASWHAQAGTPLHVLQELGGWSSAEMVKRYAHLSTKHLKGYADQIRLNGTNMTQATTVEVSQAK